MALADVQREALEEFSKDLASACGEGQRVTCAVIDVSKRGPVDAWIDSVLQDHGKLDGACNLAGISGSGFLLGEVSDEEWDRVMGINCYGV